MLVIIATFASGIALGITSVVVMGSDNQQYELLGSIADLLIFLGIVFGIITLILAIRNKI